MKDGSNEEFNFYSFVLWGLFGLKKWNARIMVLWVIARDLGPGLTFDYGVIRVLLTFSSEW